MLDVLDPAGEWYCCCCGVWGLLLFDAEAVPLGPLAAFLDEAGDAATFGAVWAKYWSRL